MSERMNLIAATGPNPPWTGLYFNCEQCGAHYQLGASDVLKPADVETRADAQPWLAPACWTCGHVNVVWTPAFKAGAIRRECAS